MNALFEYEQYMPHGMCLLWEPWLVLLWAGSDLLIFFAYMLIPLALFMVLRRRPEIRHRGLVTLFASFILLCGVTHAMSIVTLWTAIYPLMGALKLLTGLVSLATAIALFRLIPALVRIPTPDRHEALLDQLYATLDELTEARDELEHRVEQRTEELEEANLRLAYVARDAVQRSRKLIQVVSSLTRPGVDASQHPASFLRELRGRINALTIATSTVMEQSDQSTARLKRVIERQIEPLFSNPRKQLHVDGPDIEVGAQGAQQISLAVWELASRLVQTPIPSRKLPLISVTWSIDADGQGDPCLSLEWREQAAPADPDQDGLAGEKKPFHAEELSEFGQALLTRIVPTMLGGEGEINVEDDAFVYRLSCLQSAIDDLGDDGVTKALGSGEMQQQLLAGV